MPVCSLTAYRELLDLARREGWTFRDYDADVGGPSRTIILRHDVDYSIDKAVELARVNAEFGVRGTFFLLLRSNLYNLLAPRNLSKAKELIGCGQRVGLHFAALDPAPDDVTARVADEMQLLKRELPEAAPIVAWHNPTAAWLERFGDFELPGLINVYDRRFTKDMQYRSDSNLQHAAESFAELLRNRESTKLHLLFHPVVWSVGGRDMFEILGGTWRQVIREREDEFGLNRIYSTTFPNGMPPEIVEGFVAAWSAAAVSRKAAA